MTQQATAPTSSNKRILLIAFMTIFLDLLGFGIIIPIQPFYAEAFGARPFTVTLLGASYSAMCEKRNQRSFSRPRMISTATSWLV